MKKEYVKMQREHNIKKEKQFLEYEKKYEIVQFDLVCILKTINILTTMSFDTKLQLILPINPCSSLKLESLAQPIRWVHSKILGISTAIFISDIYFQTSIQRPRANNFSEKIIEKTIKNYGSWLYIVKNKLENIILVYLMNKQHIGCI